MRAMSLSIRSRPYVFFGTRLGLNSTKRCSPGPPVYATATGSGQNIGTTRSQDRYRSSPTNREKEMFQTVSARFMSNAANVTNSFTNIGYTETQKIVGGACAKRLFISSAFETNAATTF